MCVLESKLTSKFGDLFLSRIYLSQEKKNKIEKENYTTVDEHIGSTRKSEYMTYKYKGLWSKCKEKKSSSNPEKNQKMKCIKSLPLGNIECDKENNNSRNDEEELEEIHEEKKQSRETLQNSGFLKNKKFETEKIFRKELTDL